MSEIWKPQSIQTYKDWITMILADTQSSGVELTDWENKFITSVWLRLTNHNLTEAMAISLEQIYVKYTN